jgi:hypothetical protein
LLPEQLAEEVRFLQVQGYSVELVEAQGWANVVFHGYPLPPRYSKLLTELLVRIPLSYPNGSPDMFWTDGDLALADGTVPRNADALETALGKQWRRFSWHPHGWNPGSSNILTYLEFINNRLAKAV